MINVADLFPKAQSRPQGCIRLDSKVARYSAKRYGDTLEKENRPVGTITKIGRKFWNDSEEFGRLSYQICGSFPLLFTFPGNLSDLKARIGNSVPPLFMRAIALQIQSKVFNVSIELPSGNPRNSYLQTLEEAWQQHLAPRADNAPTVISTFAGAGGSSLGYSMAGYRELLAVEWDNNAVETFKLNFPDVPVYHGDIAKLSVDECLQMAGIKVGELDVLDGSPPCQGFSTAGKRLMDDPRNQLFREYVRLLRGLQPKVFVMENVSGMVKGKMKLVFVEILKELKDSGYQVKACLLNAMYFNVPQSRQRMIFIGVRNDLGIAPTHPKAQSRPILASQAIEGIQATEYVTCKGWGLKVWNLLKPGEDLAQYNVEFSSKGSGHGHMKLHPYRVCPTVTKSPTFTHTGKMHWSEVRSMAIEEIKAFSSFPSQFLLQGSFDDKWSRIGNSVPPLFMRVIAQHIREQILNKI